MIEYYKALANEIVLKAVKDYRSARNRLNKPNRTPSAIGLDKNTIKEIKRFLKSDYLRSLTKVDGNIILQMLESEGK